MLRSHWEMVGESAGWFFVTGAETMPKPCRTNEGNSEHQDWNVLDTTANVAGLGAEV